MMRQCPLSILMLVPLHFFLQIRTCVLDSGPLSATSHWIFRRTNSTLAESGYGNERRDFLLGNHRVYISQLFAAPHLTLRGGSRQSSSHQSKKAKSPSMKFVSGGLLNQKSSGRAVLTTSAPTASPITKPRPPPEVGRASKGSAHISPRVAARQACSSPVYTPPPQPQPQQPQQQQQQQQQQQHGDSESGSWPEEMYAGHPELLARRRARDSERRLQVRRWKRVGWAWSVGGIRGCTGKGQRSTSTTRHRAKPLTLPLSATQ
jgi:hypothetical protein